jgi:hypothetical protein
MREIEKGCDFCANQKVPCSKPPCLECMGTDSHPNFTPLLPLPDISMFVKHLVDCAILDWKEGIGYFVTEESIENGIKSFCTKNNVKIEIRKV